MIDHVVTVGDQDVSNEVMEVEIEQQIVEADSDPGKITIKLANPAQKYTNRFPPQTTPIEIIFKNGVYDSEVERRLAGGMAEVEYLAATGHMTDLSANHEEAVVQGECDLGHLADALPKDHDYNVMPITAREVLETILAWHDTPITLDWDPALEDKQMERITYDADVTYQDVCQDIADLVGAIYYFSEANILCFRNPASTNGEFDLDPYITNPDQTASIMGFRNAVVIIGNKSDAPYDPVGIETPSSEPIIAVAMDLDSIAEVGVLMAPAEYAYNVKTLEDAQARADQKLRMYRMHKNALTKPTVVGIVPPLQSIVSYTPFFPIAASELAKMNQTLGDRLKELQDLENQNAEDNGRAAKKIQISDKVRGVVVGKKVTYNIDGLMCDLTISPGMLDVSTPITDEDISGSIWNPVAEEETY
jgi:hypothetical protein